MKALVFNGPRDIRYEDFKDPERTIADAVILQVEKCSICGSDLHIYHGDYIGTTNYDADQHKFCVGHEFIGEVVDIGPDVHNLKVGEKVLSAGGTGCGTCNYCRTSQTWKCRQVTAFGLSHAMNGGQAEFVQIPNADRTLMRIPEGVNDEQAVLLTDALATAAFGINNTGLKPGQSLAVVGLGPIGLLGIELAFLNGASQVFAIDPLAARRAQAEKLGALAFAPGKEAIGAIVEASKGGVNCVFEASGAKSAVLSTLPLVRQGGALSFIGLPQSDLALPLNHILYKGLTVKAGVAPVQDLWEPLIPMLQTGRLKAAGLFSHEMDLADGAQAYQIFDSREESVIKIMMSVP